MNYPPEIRLSYSTLRTLHSCPRKFEITRFRNPNLNNTEYEDTLDTIIGSALHAGLQSWLLHQDDERAVVDCWTAYRPWLEEDSKAKHWGTLLDGLEQLILRMESSDWRLLGSRVEYSYRIWINKEKRHYYCGFMDGVLQNQDTGEIACLEAKTTGMKFHNLEPQYANSNQGLGNSIVLDAEVPDHSSFAMVYPVVQFISPKKVQTFLYEFQKSRMDRLEWLQGLIMEYEQILRYLEFQHFPKNGDSCMSWGKPCPFFGGCEVTGDEWSPVKDAPPDGWEIEFELDELIQIQIERGD